MTKCRSRSAIALALVAGRMIFPARWNIRYGRPATDDQVIAAARSAFADDSFVRCRGDRSFLGERACVSAAAAEHLRLHARVRNAPLLC